MRYYVVSDIHGFHSQLIAALNQAGFFTDQQPHKLIILGDLFDRGKEAKELEAFISDLMDKDLVILIRGNHEDLYEDLVTVDKGIGLNHHISNGTYDTALQLSGFDPVIATIRHYDFAEAAQLTIYYQKIIPAMRDFYETEHYVFVHGWIPCFRERHGYSHISDWRKASDDLWKNARWVNGMAAYATVYEEDKVIVCGHWHTSYGHSKIDHNGSEFGSDAVFTPFYGNGIIALDACTSKTGFVNCIVLEE